jgi:DNA-binding transcriptional LysR family regulator
MLDLHRLRLLAEFARHGSIAATATALGYSASAVSQQLAALEREAGRPLLARSPRSAELTDAGHRLAAHAARILAEVATAEADLAAHDDTPSGRVVVSAFATAAVALAPAVVRRLRRFPNLSVVLRQASPARNLDRLRAGETDLALVDDWTGEWLRRKGNLRFVELCHDPAVLVVPHRHPLARVRRPTVADLADQTWIAAPPDEPSRQALDTLLAEADGQPRPPWEFQGLDTIVTLVAQGLGIAMVPRMATVAVRRGLVSRPLPAAAAGRTIYAVTRPTAAARPAVTVVLDALRESAADHVDRWR